MFLVTLTILCAFALCPVNGFAVGTNDIIIGVSLLPILAIGIIFVLTLGKLDGSMTIVLVILVFLAVGVAAGKEEPDSKAGSTDSSDGLVNLTRLVEELKTEIAELKKLQKDNEQKKDFVESRKDGVEKEEEKEKEKEVVNIETDQSDPKDEIEKLKKNCPLSVLFELDHCDSRNLDIYRNKAEKCEDEKLAAADYSDLELTISMIDMSSKAKRFSSIVNILKVYAKLVATGDQKNICRLKTRLNVIKKRYPNQFVFMKYVLDGHEEQVSQMYTNFENSKISNQMAEWIQSGAWERLSFKRTIAVLIGCILTLIILPLIMNKSAMKYYSFVFVGVLAVGGLLVVF